MASSKIITLITGANVGIGYELAAQLLADGKYHVLLGSRSAEKGAAAVNELQARQLPGTVELQQIDVDSEESITAAANAVESKHGRLDALVNNAAIVDPPGTLAEKMAQILRTNVTGAALVVEAFAPLLKKTQGTPRIVNVSSGSGSISIRLNPDTPMYKSKGIAYRVSKAGFNMVSACQAVEYGEQGFKVFCYNPGYTVSNLSSMNKAELGAQPTSKGAEPMVKLLSGERDEAHGKFITAAGELPW